MSILKGSDALLPQNVSYADISINIVTINPDGSLDIKVSSDKKIKDIILWAEFRNNSQEEHIGVFRPIVGHAYTEGCSGLPNSTITNYEDFTNGVAFLENEPVLFHVFTLDKPIYIQENNSSLPSPSSSVSQTTSSSTSTAAGESAKVDVSDQVSSEASILQGDKWNNVKVLVTSFLAAGIMLIS
ncbi:1671_t:CDS:2 [Acaulospora colombiana]|uniref:1671_t:CDS:1 n=1 Tax=Acaulospora colombiana TaxID=27376 RepID=A0ACA9LBA1_9GLOM|nr:1671_t:CDS:2 [Acaulospora colombiana]